MHRRLPATSIASLPLLAVALAACGIPSVFLVRDGSHDEASDTACTVPGSHCNPADATIDATDAPLDSSFDSSTALDTGADVTSDPGAPVDACSCPAPRACVAGRCPHGWRTIAASPLEGRRGTAFTLIPERHEMIVWGGLAGGTSTPLADGARYDWQSDTWTMMSPSPLSGRARSAAVWTGSVFIIWGGTLVGSYRSDGAVYNPARDSWSPISPLGAPSARASSAVAWTGTEMVVYGGDDGSRQGANDGAIYNPATDHWTPMVSSGGPSTIRAALGWSGSKLFVWGGDSAGGAAFCSGAINSGGTALPGGSWTATTNLGAPSPRFFTDQLCIADWFTPPWTGSEFFVWGGYDNAPRSDGAMLRPDIVIGGWRMIGTAPMLMSRGGYLPTAVWTGTNVLGWGLTSATTGTDVVYTYVPSSDSWTASTPPGAPPIIIGGPAYGWTGSELLVWGGRTSGTNTSNQGGAYLP